MNCKINFHHCNVEEERKFIFVFNIVLQHQVHPSKSFFVQSYDLCQWNDFSFLSSSPSNNILSHCLFAYFQFNHLELLQNYYLMVVECRWFILGKRSKWIKIKLLEIPNNFKIKVLIFTLMSIEEFPGWKTDSQKIVINFINSGPSIHCCIALEKKQVMEFQC